MPAHCDSLDGPVVTAAQRLQAILGFHVYANNLYQCLHADPHGEHRHG